MVLMNKLTKIGKIILRMVFKNSNPKSSITKILPKNQRPIDVSVLPDGTTQFICHTKLQVDAMNKVFTDRGNIPVGYEEWDKGKDKKYILTYIVMDDNSPLPIN